MAEAGRESCTGRHRQRGPASGVEVNAQSASSRPCTCGNLTAKLSRTPDPKLGLEFDCLENCMYLCRETIVSISNRVQVLHLGYRYKIGSPRNRHSDLVAETEVWGLGE
jgi:hypothetical protein